MNQIEKILEVIGRPAPVCPFEFCFMRLGLG